MEMIKKVDITPMRAMFGKIVIGEDIERLIINNFSIPNTKKPLEVFFNSYNGVFDSSHLFHFVTYFMTFLYKVAPVSNQTFINSISVKDTIFINGRLIVTIVYNTD